MKCDIRRSIITVAIVGISAGSRTVNAAAKSTKAERLAALKESYMSVYLRLKGIVPPSSEAP